MTSTSTRVWLDAGPGSLSNLLLHCSLAELDAVVLTHEHLDHWLDLMVAHTALRHHLQRSPLPVYATEGTRTLADRLRDTSKTLAWQVVADGDETTLGDQRWRFSRTDHPVETLAVRVDSDGRSFAFSADTAAGWSFVQLGDGLHLGLCEATYTETARPEEATHLSARQAGAMAAAAGVERLLLTHLGPGSDAATAAREASASFCGPVEVVGQNRSYQV